MTVKTFVRSVHRTTVVWPCVALLMVSTLPGMAATVSPDPARIRAGIVPGGIVSILDPIDITTATAFANATNWTVHCLARTPTKREQLLAQIQTGALGGKISVSVWSGGRLPYAGHLITVLVADLDALGATAPTRDEMMRVVAPLGVTATATNGNWNYEKAPVPPEMDTWPQWRHDAGRSRSSHDRVVGPSGELQWDAGQVHGESPRLVAEVVVVTANEKRPTMFRGYNAFTGTLLWQRTVNLSNFDTRWGMTADWYWGERTMFSATTHRGRLFAASTPVTVIDLASGTDAGPLAETGRVARIWGDGDGIIVVGLDQLSVFDAKTLAPQWRKSVVAYDLVSDSKGTLWYLDVTKTPYDLVSCSSKDGKETMRTSLADWWVDKYQPSWPNFSPAGKTLPPIRIVMCADGRLLLRSAKDNGHLVCLDSATGKEVWRYDQREALKGTKKPDIVLAGADPIVLAGNHLWFPLGRDTSRDRMALDFATGKVVTNGTGNCVNDFCQLAYGTARMACFKDNSWMDAATGKPVINNWNNPVGNNTCSLQALPAYGLTFFGPKDCNCSTVGNGVRAAVDVAQTDDAFLAGKVKAEHPVETGSGKPVENQDEPSWPCYLGSPRRLSSVDIAFLKTPTLKWEKQTPVATAGQWLEFVAGGDSLTQPVLDTTMVVVADAEGGRVVALNRATGTEVWTRSVGGRVWAPPTLVGGRCITGSDDGWVTCLDLRDGEICWRTRAAPAERLIAMQGRVVSTWPVLESPLPTTNGVVVVIAGRLQATAAGSWAVAIDPVTGQVRWSRRWDKGLPTLSSEGLVYRQANLRARLEPTGGSFLKPSDGTDIKSSTAGFRMHHQSSQPAVSRRSPDTAFAPAAWSGSRLFIWCDMRQGPQLRCLPTGVPAAESDRNLSGVFGVPCATKPAWAKSSSEIGNVTAIVAVHDGVLVTTTSTAKDGKTLSLLRLLGAEDGAERWNIAIPAPVVHQGLAVDANGMVASCKDGRVLHLVP